MTPKRSIFIAALCGLALAGAGCGDDEENQALSYDETGDEISQICEGVNVEGLNGTPKNDAPILEQAVPDFEQAIQEVRDLEVDSELEGTRDQFADNGDQQLAIIREAQEAAEAGDKKEYRRVLERVQPLDTESEELASKLGATGCMEEDEG